MERDASISCPKLAIPVAAEICSFIFGLQGTFLRELHRRTVSLQNSVNRSTTWTFLWCPRFTQAWAYFEVTSRLLYDNGLPVSKAAMRLLIGCCYGLTAPSPFLILKNQILSNFASCQEKNIQHQNQRFVDPGKFFSISAPTFGLCATHETKFISPSDDREGGRQCGQKLFDSALTCHVEQEQ